MTFCRTLPLVAAIMISTLAPAAAQFGGMPGLPGSGPPGMPRGMPGGPGAGFGAPQQGPPPACQQLLAFRDETAKGAAAISAANKRHAPVAEACRLFKSFYNAQGKMMRAIEEKGPQCGVPPEVNNQLKAENVKVQQIMNQVCEAAARGPAPSGPTLSEALGTSLSVPSVDAKKPGIGTFDTLTGNPLAR
jgi:hypothetical protein